MFLIPIFDLDIGTIDQIDDIAKDIEFCIID